MDAWIDNSEIKQVVIITEGKFGSGISPVEAARISYGKGIAVSALGISNPEGSSNKYIEMVKEIAEAGGGLWDYSNIEELERKVREITHNTTFKTIERIVGRQLKVIIGEDIQNLEPQSRKKIIDFIEKYGGGINLKCIVVIDTGKNIKGSLAILKRSITGLLYSFQERKGNSSIAVVACSGETAGIYKTICYFTGDISLLKQNLEQIHCSGDRQAGAAILKACELMNQYYEVYNAH